jgi:hypothetical protein
VRPRWVVAWVAAALPLVAFYFELRQAWPLFADGLRVTLALAVLAALPEWWEVERRRPRSLAAIRVVAPALLALVVCTWTGYASAAVRFHAFRAEYDRAVETVAASPPGAPAGMAAGTTYGRVDVLSGPPAALFFAWDDVPGGYEQSGVLHAPAPRWPGDALRGATCRPIARDWYYCVRVVLKSAATSHTP